jgi:hypothetical protein
VRTYEHPQLGKVVGRKNAKRLGLIPTKKQQRRARLKAREAAARWRSQSLP